MYVYMHTHVTQRMNGVRLCAHGIDANVGVLLCFKLPAAAATETDISIDGCCRVITQWWMVTFYYYYKLESCVSFWNQLVVLQSCGCLYIRVCCVWWMFIRPIKLVVFFFFCGFLQVRTCVLVCMHAHKCMYGILTCTTAVVYRFVFYDIDYL